MVKKLIREKKIAHTIIAALFSVSLIFGMGGVSLPLQQPQQGAYAQAVPPAQTTPSSSQLVDEDDGQKEGSYDRLQILSTI